MTKYTLKELRRLVAIGAARDITSVNADNLLKSNYEKIGYSRGIYGINGGLIKDADGNFYAITARSSNLFRFF